MAIKPIFAFFASFTSNSICIVSRTSTSLSIQEEERNCCHHNLLYLTVFEQKSVLVFAKSLKPVTQVHLYLQLQKLLSDISKNVITANLPFLLF